MRKIRTLVAHNDEIIKNEIINSIKDLDFVEIVGTAVEGIETYNKIIDLKPEMVFTSYSFENMNGLEIIKKAKQELNNNLPVFNIIGQNINETELNEMIKLGGNKLNALINEPCKERTINIIKEYNEYLYK